MNAYLNTCKTYLCAVLIGLVIALFSLTPFGTNLEEEFGLSWLFKSRGSIRPPEQVIIVSIDKESAEILRLPDDPEQWPRSHYARLIDKLNQQNPSIIAFNMTFEGSRDPENDRLLAQAMVKGKNIILSNYLKQNTILAPGSNSEFKYERIIDPLPDFEQAALGTAPFPLPKTASTVKQFWIYKKSAGDIATFPAIVFQCFVFKQAYPEILQLLDQLKPPFNFQVPATFEQHPHEYDVIETIQTIKTAFTSDPQSLEQLEQLIKTANFSAEKKQLLSSWLALSKNPNSLYFNHYGAAGTITTIPFYQALASDILNPDLFHNKIILVGYSENIEPEKSQGLYTVFSSADSEITSPIEIAATAVANLIDKTWLKPLQFQDQFLLILGWSVLLFGVCRLFPYKAAISLIITLNLAYAAFAYTWFITASVWIPLFTPIVVLTPLFLILKSISHFLKGKQEHQKMQKAFSLFLPDNVVSSLTQNHDINTMNQYGELMQGVCMATDAGQYTTLSENMPPQKLSELVNDYYSVMFQRVKKFKGIISDVIGDAMLAIWTETEQETQARIDACKAALEIKTAIDHFNHSQPCQLPTRLGLHFGEIRLGNVGAVEHYEYRAVGDTVNTATRIEGLNKLLGTQILVSAEVINDLPGFLTREMGFFILKGKTQPIHIYELIAGTDQLDSHRPPVVSEFSKALKLFLQQQWSEALDAWLKIERIYPGDGPTLFYIHYLKQNIHLLSEQHDFSQSTVIHIGNNTNLLHS